MPHESGTDRPHESKPLPPYPHRVSFASSTELLVLHAVRIKGMVDGGSLSQRFSLDRAHVEELLLDFEASGLIQRVGFADVRGWSLTESGRNKDSRLLAAELQEAAARDAVVEAHNSFVQLNSRFLETITRWQIRPMHWDAMASNDHSDWQWDERVRSDLTGLARRLRPIEEQLSGVLARFGGYVDRLDDALVRVHQGNRKWVDEPRIDSCHTVWFELHEDLIATLGLTRGG
jgi:DNA-binding MarR family transcriptional regulator